MSGPLRIALAALLLAGGSTWAQDTAEGTRDAAPESGSRLIAVVERLREAIRLPRTAEESREIGVEEERVREVLRTARETVMPAGELREIFVVENEAIRAGGDPGNFGAAVQQLKASGLRGRALAQAIHVEQIARGMKQPPKGAPMSKGKGKGQGAQR